jgi:hypothetical protein
LFIIFKPYGFSFGPLDEIYVIFHFRQIWSELSIENFIDKRT